MTAFGCKSYKLDRLQPIKARVRIQRNALKALLACAWNRREKGTEGRMQRMELWSSVGWDVNISSIIYAHLSQSIAKGFN